MNATKSASYIRKCVIGKVLLAAILLIAAAPACIKAPDLSSEADLVFYEDFGVGIALGTRDDKVLCALGPASWEREFKHNRGYSFGPNLALAVNIYKATSSVSDIYIFNARDEHVRSRLTLFGQSLQDITPQYLSSILPSGTLGPGGIVADQRFSWEAPLAGQESAPAPFPDVRFAAWFNDRKLDSFSLRSSAGKSNDGSPE